MKMNNSWCWALALLFVMNASVAAQDIPKPDLSSTTGAIREGYELFAERVRKAESGDFSQARKAEAWGLLGMYLLAHEFYAEAKESFSVAKEIMPLDARWLYFLGYIAQIEGNNEETITYWLRSIDLNSDYYPTMIRLGRLYLESGELDLAHMWLNRAREFPPARAAALVGLGKVLLQQGKASEAVPLFKEALELQPGADKLHFYLAQAYGAMGEAEKSEKEIKQSGKFDVNLPDLLLSQVRGLSRSAVQVNAQAVSYLYAGAYEKALQLALKASSLDPANPHSLLTLAYAHAQLGDHDQAMKSIRRVLEIRPDDASLWYAAGAIEEMLGEDAKTVSMYKKAVDLRPAHASALFALGKAMMRLGQYEEAIKWLKKAEEAKPDDAFVVFRLAYSQLYTGECRDSLKSFYKAIDMQPENFAFLTGFVQAVVVCGGERKDKENALNAARNMYKLSPVVTVVETLAAIESIAGDRKAAIDYQAQALFLASKSDIPVWLRKRLKQNFEKIVRGEKPDVKPNPQEKGMFPEARKDIF